jgi:asparagine synthase (glutamine-hydrolysing)
MCAILGVLRQEGQKQALPGRAAVLALSKQQRHRGPDWTGVWSDEHALLVHERLAIVGVDSGAQPLVSDDGRYILAVNGEIYNHQALAEAHAVDYPFQTHSDCEVILPLYARFGVDCVNMLRGMFAFILYDTHTHTALIARDHMGIIPLYVGHDAAGLLYVASEMKALIPVCSDPEVFAPGHFWMTDQEAPQAYYQPAWRDAATVLNNSEDAAPLHDALKQAVRSHMMADVPYGVLLSGGLDSSLIAAIAAHYAKRRVEDEGQSEAWWPRLHSFAVGLEGAPDLKHAQAVAERIGTVHHEMHFTVQEGLDALSDVIHTLETYDVTTVRASTPMYLMARQIKAMGIKMVLSGEGADELFGGYLYFHKAPNAQALHEETVRKLDRLHHYDCLRANKSMSAWGVEARVPFLDRDFMDVAMQLNPSVKLCGKGRMEKHVLREAFDGMLPESVLWRQKEQFSDGVGYGWIDALQAYAEAEISDAMMAEAEQRFPYHPPATKEAYVYRRLFEAHFPGEGAARTVPGGKSVACSTPEALAWDASLSQNVDPSGRAVLGVHDQSY